MNSPFYQPARQSFSSSQSMQQPQGGFGVQTAGTFGGFQPQPSFSGNVFGGGFGGGFQPQQQSFGGFGGGQGFGGFNPFQGGFGGFQQQQQFNPYQSGYGGGFNPYQGGFQPQQQQFNPYQGSYGGMPQQGFNPMFGGIGGLGFNPIMGPQFGMPMQGFNPYQIQMMYRGGPEMSPEMRQRREQDMRNAENEVSHFGLWGGTGEYDPKTGQIDLGRPRPPAAQPQSPFTGPQRSAQDILSMAVGKTPQDMQYDLNKDGKITSADALAYQRQYGQQPAQQPQQPAPESPGLGRLPYDPEYERPAGYGTTQPAVPQRAQQTIADYRRQQPQSPSQSLDTLRNTVVQAQQQNPAYAQLQELRKQFGGNQAPTQEQLQQLHSLQRQIENDPAVRGAQNRYETNARQHQTEDIRRRMQGELPQPMYGGIGGLGFNPMMGPQFGMPMQGFNPMMGQQFSSDHMGDMMSRGGPEMSRLSELQRGLARQQERLMGTQDMPLTADQKYQQAQQFGNQSYLYANSPAGRAAAAHFAMG